MHTPPETAQSRSGISALTIGVLMLVWLSCADHASAGLSAPNAQGWQEVDTTPDGGLYHRPMQGSAIPQVLIATRFAAPPASVYAVVTDYAHFAEFIPDVAESRIIRAVGDVQWVFHRLHFIGPVADRTYVMRSVGNPGRADTDEYRVEWALAQDALPAGEHGIRPTQFSGFWELRPIDGGKATEARYAVHSDPGGHLPAWLVTHMTDRYVRDVAAAVRGRLK